VLRSSSPNQNEIGGDRKAAEERYPKVDEERNRIKVSKPSETLNVALV
jgi:hypothetical protein